MITQALQNIQKRELNGLMEKGTWKVIILLALNFIALSIAFDFSANFLNKSAAYEQSKEALLQKLSSLQMQKKTQDDFLNSKQGIGFAKKLNLQLDQGELDQIIRREAEARKLDITEIQASPTHTENGFDHIKYHANFKSLSDFDLFSLVEAVKKKAQTIVVIHNVSIKRVPEFSEEFFEKALSAENTWLFEGHVDFSVIARNPGQ